jgi:two-component system chemotaxis sensor kinase CheA
MIELVALFRAETADHLTKLDNGLVELEKRPDQTELVKSLNREIHTLKGAARVFGFKDIQNIAHGIEDAFEGVIAGRVTFSSSVAGEIFKGLDGIRELLKKIDEKRGPETETGCLEVCREPERGAPSVEVPRTGKKGERKKKTSPSQANPEKGEGRETPNPEDKAMPHGNPAAETRTSKRVPETEEFIRVPLNKVNKLLYLAGEVVINKIRSSMTRSQARKLSRLSKEAQKNISGLSDAVKRELPSLAGDVPKWLSQCEVQMRKLREQTLKLYDQVTTEAFHLDPIIDELQAGIKEIKMVPVSTLFDSFPRMVRDIAFQQRKEVRLVICGDETMLDKKVLDGIQASLIHILRNCVDHGIERPEVRKVLGKPAEGTIKISALHQGDNVVITVEDDGKGLDTAQIRETALARRLLSSSELGSMTEKEVLNLIFLNGYSTSPAVTEVSGRGMGLDIVRRDIAQLKGRVVLDSEINNGARFTLILPLTIAIVQVLLVKIREMVFAIPMLSIAECLRIGWDDVSSVGGRMAFQLRDRIVPLVGLDEALELPPAPGRDREAKKEILVAMITSLDRRVGFVVDEILGEDEVFVKSLGKFLGKVKNASGAMILPTGEVVVVLDTADLIAHASLTRRPLMEERMTPMTKRGEKRILIVEDAFSTRELEKSILETHGYLVDTAVDGLDALDRVTTKRYDLIVSDVEMPRMDGFELCRTLKRNEGYRDIPFVMVTALQKEEDKRRGLEVGAAGYIVKSGFEQTSLLDAVERLVG